MRQSDILDKLKRKHPNLTEEGIKLILNSFHAGLRHYLSHPEECKAGILINKLMCIYIPPKRVELFLDKIQNQNEIYRYDNVNRKERKKTKEEIVEYYEDLLQTVKKYERKKR